MASSVLIERPALPAEVMEVRDALTPIREEFTALLGDTCFLLRPSSLGLWYFATTLRTEARKGALECFRRLTTLPHGVEYIEHLGLLKVWSADPRAVLLKVRRIFGLAT